MSQGKIVKVAGPLIVAENMRDANMSDVVCVGKQRLIGEIIEMREDKASIQVYEETAGIGPGDMVESTGAPLSVELAPGVLTSIFDGIQRPLTKIREIAGSNITRGIEVTSLDHEKKWDFVPTAKVGDQVVMRRRAGHRSGDRGCHPQDHGAQGRRRVRSSSSIPAATTSPRPSPRSRIKTATFTTSACCRDGLSVYSAPTSRSCRLISR